MKSEKKLTIGICAPSSALPLVELECGILKLKEAGLNVRVHPYARGRKFLFSQTDVKRAQSILDFARDPSIDILWAGRGGYGANRVVSYLENEKNIPEKKLFIGFSDATLLLDFFKNQWNWCALHGSMPATQSFLNLSEQDWGALLAHVQKDATVLQKPMTKAKDLFWYLAPQDFDESGPLVGGNLSLWAALLGTKYFPKVQESFLFLEDIGEPLGRLDRMVQQLHQAHVFKGIKGLVIGTFEGCEDRVPQVWGKKPKLQKGKWVPAKVQVPLRKSLAQKKVLKEIFCEIADKNNIPLIMGVPAGHGQRQYPLAFGGDYRFSKKNGIQLVKWNWFDL